MGQPNHGVAVTYFCVVKRDLAAVDFQQLEIWQRSISEKL
jgi:hypothetical protein